MRPKNTSGGSAGESHVQEKDIYVESILEDSKRLGADIDKVTYTSNYFPQMLDLAERLIKAGHLYADDTPQETMKEVRLLKCQGFCRLLEDLFVMPVVFQTGCKDICLRIIFRF